MRHSERYPINWLRSTCKGAVRTTNTNLCYYIILLLWYYTTVIVCTTLDAATVAVQTSWRVNPGIVHIMLQWHNSFTSAPTRLVATADILRFMVVRYSIPPPPTRASSIWTSPEKGLQDGRSVTGGGPRGLRRGRGRFRGRGYKRSCESLETFSIFTFLNFTRRVYSMIFGVRCHISSIALFHSPPPLTLFRAFQFPPAIVFRTLQCTRCCDSIVPA